MWYARIDRISIGGWCVVSIYFCLRVSSKENLVDFDLLISSVIHRKTMSQQASADSVSEPSSGAVTTQVAKAPPTLKLDSRPLCMEPVFVWWNGLIFSSSYYPSVSTAAWVTSWWLSAIPVEKICWSLIRTNASSSFRSFCSRRLRRIRKSLELTYGNQKKFQKPVITDELVAKDSRCAHLNRTQAMHWTPFSS